MPINQKMMRNMKKEYGSKKGESIYYALENKKKKKKRSITDEAARSLKWH